MSVFRIKRLVQAVMIAAVAVYTTLLVYHSISASGYAHQPQVEAGWQERAPRSLSSRDYDANANTIALGPPPAPPPARRRPQPPAHTPAPAPSAPSASFASPVPAAPPSPPAPPPAPSTAATPAGTGRGAALSPDDLFISVKTTRSYHRTRLPVLLKTWFQLARNQTWFFTDSDDPEFQEKTNGHVINTNCSSSHNRKALCCKMSVEFDVFLESGKKWFCHVDDDNYVNVPRLLRLLGGYSAQDDWYLGKPSIRAPLEIVSRDSPKPSKVSFWFATGGAGFCLSRALTLNMVPVASGGKFISIGEKIRLPDDVTMGYIIEHLLRKPLTVIEQFHSHLEPMKFLQQDTFHDQITFSYSRYNKEEMNVVKIDGFDVRADPTRFLSIHCFLFPNFSFCPR